MRQTRLAPEPELVSTKLGRERMAAALRAALPGGRHRRAATGGGLLDRHPRRPGTGLPRVTAGGAGLVRTLRRPSGGSPRARLDGVLRDDDPAEAPGTVFEVRRATRAAAIASRSSWVRWRSGTPARRRSASAPADHSARGRSPRGPAQIVQAAVGKTSIARPSSIPAAASAAYSSSPCSTHS